ncbi:retrovirus-related pol polyprotein from transposon TNT 1-94 [Tanacetum coccineum]
MGILYKSMKVQNKLGFKNKLGPGVLKRTVHEGPQGVVKLRFFSVSYVNTIVASQTRSTWSEGDNGYVDEGYRDDQQGGDLKFAAGLRYMHMSNAVLRHILPDGSQVYQLVCTRSDLASWCDYVGWVHLIVGSLKANLQYMEALSTTEARYMTFTEALKKEIWLKGLLIESGYELSSPANAFLCCPRLHSLEQEWPFLGSPFQMVGTFIQNPAVEDAKETEGALQLGPERARVFIDLIAEEKERYLGKCDDDSGKVLKLTKDDRDVRDRYNVNNQGRPFQRNNARGNVVAGNVGGQNRVGNMNPGQAKPIMCYNYKGIGHIARECPQPKHPQDSDYFKDKMLLMNAHKNGDVLRRAVLFLAGEQVTNFDDDVDDLALNVDHVFEADQCDAFDSDVDEGSQPT